MKIQSAISKVEKAGYTKLHNEDQQRYNYRKGDCLLSIVRNGRSDNAAMISVKRYGVDWQGILEHTIKGALARGEKFATGEWK